MAVIKQAVQTRTALTVTGLSTLASATFVTSATYVPNTNQPLDVIVEAEIATTNTPASTYNPTVHNKLNTYLTTTSSWQAYPESKMAIPV